MSAPSPTVASHKAPRRSTETYALNAGSWSRPVDRAGSPALQSMGPGRHFEARQAPRREISSEMEELVDCGGAPSLQTGHGTEDT
jgi:hypothetical protein